MKRTRFVPAFTLALAALLPAAPAAAQAPVTCDLGQPCNQVVRAAVNQVAQLTIPVFADFGTITAADLSAGQKDHSFEISVQSNDDWTVSIAAGTSVWDLAGVPSSKPAEDLLWALGSGPGGTPLTTTGEQVTAGSAGPSTVFPLAYRSLWSWDDLPGSYQISVVFTIAAS